MSDEQASAQAAAKEPKVIKRYTNRKLYDTVESRYVTLDEIAEMIKHGTEVKVVDNRSKEDLTSVTLAQIIFEEEKKKNQMPLSVLREIIRRPGETLTGFFQKEVGPRVESLKEEAQSRIDRLLHRADGKKEDGSPADPEGAVTPATAEAAVGETGDAAAGAGSTASELLKTSQRALEDFQRKVDERVKVVVENLVGSLPAGGRDLQALMERLESLEAKLDAIEKKR